MPDVLETTEPANDALPARVGGLRASDLSVGIGTGAGEWSPQLQCSPSLTELFSSVDDAAGEALALAFAREHLAASQDGQWLWVQDASSIRKGGRPYLHGLPAPYRSGLLHVEARNAADALWAMEEGVRCGALSFVVGELAGDPKSLDFTATRRLVLAAERHGVPLFLVRRNGFANLSAARLRWRVEAARSSDHPWNAVAPGDPHLCAELFRGRGLKPGRFTLSHGIGAHEPVDRLCVVPELRDRPLEPERSLAG